jgi:hypothetical protein
MQQSRAFFGGSIPVYVEQYKDKIFSLLKASNSTTLETPVKRSIFASPAPTQTPTQPI